MIHIKIIHQGQRNHKCDYCGKFYTQMTNLKMHLWFLCPRWIILIWIIRLADLVIYFPHETHLNHQTGWFSDIFSTWNTCPFNPILCVKFLPHLSYLYFSKSFMDIFHMHFKIFLSNNFFSTNFTFKFCKFSKCQLCSYAWGWVLIFSISWTFCYVISS